MFSSFQLPRARQIRPASHDRQGAKRDGAAEDHVPRPLDGHHQLLHDGVATTGVQRQVDRLRGSRAGSLLRLEYENVGRSHFTQSKSHGW